MQSFTKFYGIDVSKSDLDIAQLDAQGHLELLSKISNDVPAIENWISSLPKGVFCVLEATGSYSSKLAYCLADAKITFALVNPKRSKHFMEAIGLSNKTDSSSALSLAKMGCQLELKPSVMPSKQRQEQKQLHSALQAMYKQRQMLNNQLHALDQYPFVVQGAKQAYEQTLATVEQQLEKQLEDSEESDKAQQIKSLICSVKGIGPTTAQAILLTTNDLQDFHCAAQLACYLGLTPKTHYSGSSVRKNGRISKQGANRVRELLYMCTRSAIRFNTACKKLYVRLRAKGKPHKVAAVAVMHKLVKQLFACVQKQVVFDDHFEINPTIT
ncbi:MAG: IS110 family transposase [Bacteroidota bacterium]